MNAVASTAAAVPPALGAAPGLGQTFVSLLLVLAAIFALAWLLRRVQALRPGAAGALRVIGGISLGARERAVLVQVGEVQLLLAVAPGRVNLLHRLELPIGSEPAEPAGNSFVARLAEQLRKSSP